MIPSFTTEPARLPADVTQVIDSIDAVKLRHTSAVLLRETINRSCDICKYRANTQAGVVMNRGLFEPDKRVGASSADSDYIRLSICTAY